MANIKSAAKRARQAVKRTSRNSSILSSLKTEQKKLRTAIAAGDTAATKAGYASVSSALDKAAKRGAIHKNAASRGKSKFNRALSKTTAK
jgi:small subunit ribosomal protein S20